ncbi:MAG: hypothetical protein ACXABD_11940 [Candidatus Thorarchaeota archaeon]|jgi:cytidylate kinase
MSTPILIDIDLSYPKIFVTGIYGTGKSTIAKLIAQSTGHTFLDFDNLWSYQKSAASSDQCAAEHFSKLGDRFVIDAIGFNSPPDLYRIFDAFYRKHEGDVLVVCALCLSIEEWTTRITKKKLLTNISMENYIEFHINTLPMHAGKNVVYYDTSSNRRVSPANIKEVIQGLRHD